MIREVYPPYFPLFLDFVALRTMLCFKCEMGDYVSVISFWLCFLFCFGFLGSCFWFFIQGKSR